MKTDDRNVISHDCTELLEYHNRFLLDRLDGIQAASHRLLDAMHYVVTAGGKRLRPLLVYASGLAFQATLDDLHRPAAAAELIHAYSLTHDDLPAMDNDALRRGKPTCHIAYDEATAILAGDALQCLAFDLLAEPYPTHLPAAVRLENIRILSQASGVLGMAGGQSLDLEATDKRIRLDQLEQIHHLKTGCLIEACILMGANCAQISDQTAQQLKTFARCIGLAYQIHDDVLDIEASTEVLGKAQGADIELNKSTYPSIVGLDCAKGMRDGLAKQAMDALSAINADTSLLEELALKMVQRRN